MPDVDELLRHDAWLRSLVRGLVGEAHVDDVVQRTWVAAWQRPPDRRNALRSWLRRVAGNFARSYRRSEDRRREKEAVAAVPAAAELPSTEETVQRLAAQRAVTAAVMDLAEPYRTAVLLRHYHELPVQEIAARTGTTPANVRQRVKRGLDSVRERLGDEYGGEWRGCPAILALALPRTLAPVPVTVSGIPLGGAAALATFGVLIMKQKIALVGLFLVLGSVAMWWPGSGGDADAVVADGSRPEGMAAGEPGDGLVGETPAHRREAVLSETHPKKKKPLRASRWQGLKGRVLDVRGRPVMGVRVGTRSPNEIRSALREVGLWKPAFKALAESGADGRFVLGGAPSGPELTVDDRFYNVRSAVLDRRVTSEHELLVVVARAVQFMGIVVDEDGMPLPKVSLRPEIGNLTEFPLPLDRTAKHDLRSGMTGPDGRFALGPVPAEVTTVAVHREGYVSQVIEVGRRRVVDRRLVLRRVRPGERVITGHVLDDHGRPVAGARVGLAGRQVTTDERVTTVRK